MPNKQHNTTNTLPRGTLDLTSQTNAASGNSDLKERSHSQLND